MICDRFLCFVNIFNFVPLNKDTFTWPGWEAIKMKNFVPKFLEKS